MGNNNNSLPPGVQAQQMNIGPGDKYIMVVMKEGQAQPLVMKGENTGDMEALHMALGLCNIFACTLAQKYPDDKSPILKPFNGTVKMGG